MNLLEDCGQQARAVADFFDNLNVQMDRIPAFVQPDFADEEEKQMELAA
ncbi:MAG: hypothetical protein ACJA2P_000485 [Rhodoferax sp.]|jgi:hypothetical protein